VRTEIASTYADQVWEASIVPALHEFIAIPNLSAAYDANWAANGHMQRAVDLIVAWCSARPLAGLTIDVHELPGRTPVIFIEVPASNGERVDDDCVLLYGHLDKQPEMTGWRDDLGPWKPVREGDLLYGRGGADDGYSAFASLAAIEAVREAGGAHGRCVVLIEASEESGSPDLPAHVEALAARIGTPSLVICLDSGCADYDHMWITTSLRGLADGTLVVDMLDEGVHSGSASGIVASTFRVARELLDRVEDVTTGQVLLPELHVDIPADRVEQAEGTAAVLTSSPAAEFPFVAGARAMVEDHVEQLLNRTWRPTLSVTGADGLPPTTKAGNVLRPSTALQLSFRLPPTCDAHTALDAITLALTHDPPYDARVSFGGGSAANGWNAPTFAGWLDTALGEASQATFGSAYRAYGEGGSIPFMGMLGERFPDAQFVITGVIGPQSNAHGPNEFLHIPMGKRLTAALAVVLDHHARR
jgi:acetylornithine deacetylase/succinyl-diaminopimelate desuccinylase-like protein